MSLSLLTHHPSQLRNLQGGGSMHIGGLQFMVAGDEDGMMIRGALPKGTIRE